MAEENCCRTRSAKTVVKPGLPEINMVKFQRRNQTSATAAGLVSPDFRLKQL
jgi:hypothetical protein